MSFLGYFSKNYSDERGREYYFDNAKFILITLVVLAHLVSPLRVYNDKVKAVWSLIYYFHMPCMILLSGYFAKSYIKDGYIKTQRLVTYFVYYLSAQIVISIFEYFVLDYKDSIAISLIHPRESLWYLMCLCMWFAILPYIYKIRPQIIIPFSILLGLLIGYDDKIGNTMSIARALNFFPFFIIGYHFKIEWLYRFRNIRTQLVAAVVIITVGVLTYFNVNIVSARFIMGNYNYNNSRLNRCQPQLLIFTDERLWFVNRLIYYALALLLCACFMLLVPRGKAFFTKFGSRTLQVYILQCFVILLSKEYKWWEIFNVDKGFYVLAAIAVAATFILSLKIFEYPFKWLGKISIKKLENRKLPEAKIDETV